MSRNPFPGPQPYTAENRPHFFGREQVACSFLGTMLVQRCVTLYGPSGSGKSSLMQASIIPDVKASSCRVVLVDKWPHDRKPVEWLEETLRERLGLDVSLSPCGRDPKTGAESAADDDADEPIFLYLDQIEQLLLRRGREDVDTFVRCLDRLVERPAREVHLVLGIREDYLGRWRERIRGRRRLIENWLRLGHLSVDDISGAVCDAALTGEPKQAWDVGAMRRILRDVRIQGEEESHEEAPSGRAGKAAYAEEVQAAYAQIVCRALFEKGGPPERSEDARAEPILVEYLEKTLASLERLEEPARRLLEDHLIADDGSRRLLTAREAHLRGLSHDDVERILEALERAAILRAQAQGHQSGRYYELGHDWLAKKLHERKQERQREEARQREENARMQEERDRRLKQEIELRGQAEAERERARGLLLVATARELLARGKPEWAPGLLLDVASPEQTDGWAALAIEVLGQRFARATLKGHQRSLTAAAFSPDGRRVATACFDGATRVWSSDGRGDPVVLLGHSDVVWALAFSPDGRRIATGGRDGIALVWELGGAGDPVLLATLRGHEDAIVDVAFSPDGRQVATASQDFTACLWDVEGGGVKRRVLEAHDAELTSVAFAPSGDRVATGSRDGTATIWSEAGEARLVGHGGAVARVVFSPDGSRVATASADRTACVWKADGEGPPVVLAGHEHVVTAVAFSPDGQHVATASRDKTARVFRVGGAEPLFTVGPHGDAVVDVAWSPDGRHLLTASTDGQARIWTAGGMESSVLRGHKRSLVAAAWSRDGAQILTASLDDAKVWTAAGTGVPVVLEGDEWALSAAGFSHDGQRVITITENGVARLLNADGSGEASILSEPDEPIRGACFEPNGRRLALVSPSAVWIVDPDGRRESSRLTVEADWRLVAAFAPAGLVAFAVAPGGRAVKAFTLAEGAERWSEPIALDVGAAPVERLFIRMDVARVRFVTQDGAVRSWELGALSAPPVITRWRYSGLKCIAFAPDDRYALAIDETRPENAYLVTAENPSERLLLQDHEKQITYGTFSMDCTRVVTTSDDRTARVWRTDGTGRPIVLRGHRASVLHAAFSPDEARVVTASADGTARIWPLSVGALRERLAAAVPVDCMPPELRRMYRDETADQARERYEACERSHGRDPARR
ncbi:nSTAND1 domain-containing NTPase [Sorangium sp. So ce131]|uniref:nSTAND1 domain-containing NTPase n=1 Tax=Sorangium sp. So ce131 TaxID=3133282 RepID=UPI003F6422F4